MSTRRQHIRNTRAYLEASFTPLLAEYAFDTTLNTVRVGDGATLGGLLLKKWGRSYTVSPAQITANQNDYSPTDMAIAEALFLDLDADRSITGLATGATNRELTVYNTSAFRLTLVNESASSAAGNRLHLSADTVLRPYQSLRLIYSAALGRWVAIGRVDFGVTDLPENVSLSGDITPSQITSNQNDYSPTGLSLASRLRLNTDASRNVTGIAGGADGRLLIIVNVGSNALVLKNADAGSTAANRFDFGADCSLSGKQVAVIQYDATDSRWKMLANTAGAAVADSAVTAVKLAGSALSPGVRMYNGTIVESHAGNAATFALKTLAGTDPTAADPVIITFLSATGAYVARSVTAALSVTVSSGSSLGQSNAVAFQVLIVALDNAGTVELAVASRGVQTVTLGDGVNTLHLNEMRAYSTTAEGGAGAADLAATLYSASARASKQMRILARADYDTGLVAAGTWAASPTRIVLNAPGAGRLSVRPSFFAHLNSVNQTGLVHVAYNRIQFSKVRFNAGAVYDTTTHRVTFFDPGEVELSGAVFLGTNVKAPPSTVSLKIIKNGSIDIGAGIGWATAGVADTAGSFVANVRDFSTVGDYYELYVYAESKNAANDIGCDGNPAHTWFTGALVSAD